MNFDKNTTSGKSLKIFTIGHKVLRNKTKAITVFDDALQDFVNQMLECMYNNNGIGLAAPQIGESKKICVIDVTPCLSDNDTCLFNGKLISDIKTIMPIFLINPVVIEKSSETTTELEGCLSIPKFSANVRRAKKITVQFLDIKGNEHRITTDGIFARCLQHEIDHLNGILYTDLISQSDKTKLAKYLSNNIN